MPGDFKSSFIPKEPIVKRGPAHVNRGGGVNIIGTIAWVFFILVVIIAIGVFLYKILLTRSLDSKKERLATEREAFDPALIDELVALERKMEVGEGLLDDHVAVSKVFSALEEDTSQSVRFERFSYGQSSEAGGMPTLSMSGIATDFNAVAYQSDVLGDSASFRNIIFSNIEVTPEEAVTFNVNAEVDPKVIDFSPSDTEVNTEEQ